MKRSSEEIPLLRFLMRRIPCHKAAIIRLQARVLTGKLPSFVAELAATASVPSGFDAAEICSS
jgi:hypothetical protein